MKTNINDLVKFIAIVVVFALFVCVAIINSRSFPKKDSVQKTILINPELGIHVIEKHIQERIDNYILLREREMNNFKEGKEIE